MGRYLDFYDQQAAFSLDRHTPDEAYFIPTPRGGG